MRFKIESASDGKAARGVEMVLAGCVALCAVGCSSSAAAVANGAGGGVAGADGLGGGTSSGGAGAARLFASDSFAQAAPFYTAQFSDTTTWTQMPDKICAGGVCRGSNEMAYDAAHHVVYSANWGAGLWRLVTR